MSVTGVWRRLLDLIRDDRFRCPNCRAIVVEQDTFCDEKCKVDYEERTIW